MPVILLKSGLTGYFLYFYSKNDESTRNNFNLRNLSSQT